MRAVVFDRTGPPEVLRVAEVPAPRPGPTQVRVRVEAAGVQPFDALVRAGRMDVALRFPQQIGNELAGTVIEIGGEVDDMTAGDHVFGWAHMAAHADEVLVEQDAVITKPTWMGWETAGSIGASGQTALTALRVLRPRPGESLLVHGAAGGAGTAIIQIARHHGIHVIATARTVHHGALRQLGATPVAYGPGLANAVEAVAPDGVDGAITTVGGQALVEATTIVGDPSRVATLVDHELAEQLGALGVRAERSIAQLHELAELASNGSLRVPIRARFELAAVAEAHRLVETGHGHGKVIITVRRRRTDLTASTRRPLQDGVP
jgi:NADPH:quinone reductase-like Zn-dependent oxidoreductase